MGRRESNLTGRDRELDLDIPPGPADDWLDDSLSSEQFRQIDQLVDQFESAAELRPAPRIEDFLAMVEPPLRACLLACLVRSQFIGVPPQEAEAYWLDLRTRFSDYSAGVERLEAAFTADRGRTHRSTKAPAHSTCPQHDLTAGRLLICPECFAAIESNIQNQSEPCCPECGLRIGLVSTVTLLDDELQPGQTLGRYRLIEEIGQGGFGKVWRADDPKLDREVAVKVPLASYLTLEQTDRILREARLAGALRHKNIVQIHAVESDGRRLFIVSDFIQGPPLCDLIQAGTLSRERAVSLAIQLAQALDYAHQNGIVHRDFKPSNVIIDGDGEPFILDFGLARRDSSEVTMTMEGMLIGTPSHMSPEQVRGNSRGIDRRSDIYSLGVTLYEMITRQCPFRGSIRGLMDQVLHDEPQRPSRLCSQIPPDLETICLKCLEKDPSRRYQTAAELADDLMRFRDHFPIKARPASAWQRMQRWARRNPLAAMLYAALFSVLTVGLIVVSILWLHAIKARRIAETTSSQNQQLLYDADMQLGWREWEQFQLANVLPRLERHRGQSANSDRIEWQILSNESNRFSRAFMFGQSIFDSSYNHESGQVTLAIKRGDREIEIVRYSTDDNRLVSRYRVPGLMLFLSPSGKRAVIVDPNRTARLVETETNQLLDESPSVLANFGFDSNEQRVLNWNGMGSFSIREDRQERGDWNQHTIGFLGDQGRISADGKSATFHGLNGPAAVVDIDREEIVLKLDTNQTRGATAVELSSDGQLLAVAGSDFSIRVWDVSEQRLIMTLAGHESRIAGLSISADDQLLLSFANDQQINLWSLAARRRWTTLRGRAGSLSSCRIAADNKTIVEVGKDGTMVIHDLQELRRAALDFPSGWIDAVTMTEDGTLFVSNAGSIYRLAAGSRTPEVVYSGKTQRFYWLSCFADGSTMVASEGRAGSDLVVIRRGQAQKIQGEFPALRNMAVMSDGQRIILHDVVSASMSCWNLNTGKQDKNWRPIGGFLVDVDHSRNETIVHEFGKGLWIAGQDDLANTKPISSARLLPSKMARSFDQWAVALAENNRLLVFDLETGAEKLNVEVASNPTRIALSHDAQLLAWGTNNGRISLIDVTSGIERCSFRAMENAIRYLAFAPDDSVLISADQETIRFWDYFSSTDSCPQQQKTFEIELDVESGAAAPAGFQ